MVNACWEDAPVILECSGRMSGPIKAMVGGLGIYLSSEIGVERSCD